IRDLIVTGVQTCALPIFYLEGFARPLDGVRVIIRVLLDKFRSAGGERRMKCGVQQIIEAQGRAARLVLDDGTEITAGHVISSIRSEERRVGKECRAGAGT